MFERLAAHIPTLEWRPSAAAAAPAAGSEGPAPTTRWDQLDLRNNKAVTDDDGNLQYFAVEVVEQDAGQVQQVCKVITLHELAFIPLESRQDPDLLGKMHTVLRGCYDAEIDVMHIIAGMYDTDPPLGIMQFYGAIGTGESEEEALRRALLGTEGLLHTMANFPQIAFRPLDIHRTQWLREAMFSMPYALTVIGQPDPRNAARGGGRATMQGMGEVTGAVDGEVTSQQNEMLMRAMADARQSFLMMTLASRVQRSELARLLEGLARRASVVASQQRGTRGISFNLGIPIILSGLTAHGAAVTHSTSQGQGVSDVVGEATGQAHTTSHNRFTADSQTRGEAVTQGSAVTHGSFAASSSGVAVTSSSAVGSAHTAGSSWSASQVTGTADTAGSAHTVGGAHTTGSAHTVGSADTTGTADTTSVSHTAGHSTSVSHTGGTTVVQSSGSAVSSGTAHTASRGTSSGVSLGQSSGQGVTDTSGQAATVSSGQSAGVSSGRTLNLSTRHMEGISQGGGVSANVGGSAGASAGLGVAGVDARVNAGAGASANRGSSSADTSGVSHGTSSSVTAGSSSGQAMTISGSHAETASTGSSVTSSMGASTGQSSTTSAGQTSSTGTSVAQSSSTTVSSGSFSSTTRGQAHTTSQAHTNSVADTRSRADTSSWANSTSKAHTASQATGRSSGGSTADTSSQSKGQAVTVVHSRSAGHSSSVTQSVATTRSRAMSHSEGSSSGTAETTSSSRSRAHGVTETTGMARGRTLSTGASTGVMAGISPGMSVSKTFAFEDDVMGQLAQLFRQQEELARQMSLEGGYITDVYLLTCTAEGLKVAETAIPQAFHGLQDVVTPVQTRKLDDAERDHIRAHVAAWTPCATEEPILDGVNAYRHGTLLTMEQLAAYVAPGLFEEGTAATTMEKVPPLGFYPDLQGEVVLGHQISPETRKVTGAGLRLSEERMFHTLFAADTGFGKSVAAERLALETTMQWHYRTIVLDFGAGWRDMIHAPGLPPERLALWQLHPGSSRPLRWNPLQIGRRIDPDQQFRVTPELLANAGRMGPKQLGFMQETLSGLYRGRGVLTTDAKVQEHKYWGHVRDADEEEAINARHRERGQSEGHFVGQPLHLLSADELQALAIHRSKRVDIIDWYERLLALEKELKGRPSDLTSLEGIKVRLKPFTYGNMARMYRKGDDTIAIEDVALPWGMCIFEGGAQLDTYAKAALLSLMAWHLYTDAVARERQGDFYRMQVFFEEANKVLTGVSSGSGHESSPLQTVSQQFEDMWRDGRKYGIFLHPIVQTPSELPPGIISSCNNVLFGQLKNPRDRDLAVAHLSFSEKGFTDEDYRRWITRTEIGRATVRFGYTPEYGQMMPLYAAILKVPARKATEADIARHFA